MHKAGIIETFNNAKSLNYNMRHYAFLVIIVFSMLTMVSANPYSSNINQDYSSDTSVDVSFYTGNLTNLSQMADVNIPAPTDEQVLSWDSGTAKWIASTLSYITKWVIDTTNGFFYTSGNTLYFNDTLLNNTIDDRAVTSESDPIYTAQNTTIARIGNCPSGEVVVNITTGGVECIIAAGDITSVQGDDIYIYNGSDSGDVVLVFNETKLNSSVEAFGYITSFSETDPYWSGNQSSYSTTAEILAFGYYNSSDFVITDYFTKTDIENFNYYNSSDFDITDYFTSSEILAFNYYNASNFVITDYFTSAQILGFNYYNSTDFVITDYYTKTEIDNFGYYNATDFVITNYFTKADINSFGYYNASNFVITDYFTKTQIENFGYYNATDFNISDYATNVKVDSIGNFSAYIQPTHLSNFTDDLGDRGYTSVSNFTNDLGYYNSTTIPSYILSSDEGNLNVNSSDYWDDYNVASDLNNLIEIAGENITSGTIGYARLPTLDYLVLIKWANISDAPTALSFFDDDLGDRGYTHLTNFTDDLGDRGYTHLTNFTNDLGIGNWTADKVNYYNSTETDTAIETANTSMLNYVDGTFITQANEENLNVNSSDYWDDYDTSNTTWFQNIAGVLSLKLSQLTTWTDSWLATQTTDNLTEGSINLYDNQSWNQSLGDSLYATIDEPLWSANYTAYNDSWSSTYNSTYDAKADYQFTTNNFNGSGNLTTTGNITAAYFYGQPLDGALGSGIISADSIDSNGDLNVTINSGLNVSYPGFTARLEYNSNHTVNYCVVPAGSVIVPDNAHTSYNIGFDCTINSKTRIARQAEDLSPGGNLDIFDTYAFGGAVELKKGRTVMGAETQKTWEKIFNVDHLEIISGMSVSTNVFSSINSAEGKYLFYRTVKTATTQNSSNDGLHFVYHSGGVVTHTNLSQMNLTHCDDGTNLVECEDNDFRRYLIYVGGYDNTPDSTKLHQLAPRTTDITFTNIGNCVDTDETPLSYTLPDEERYVAVPLYFYCGSRDEDDWEDGWVDIRNGAGTVGASPDVSAYLRRDGTIPLTGNWNAGAYNITAQWFKGIFNWVVGVGSNYISFNGTTLNFNETKLNATGDSRYVNIDGDTMTGDLNMSNNEITNVGNLSLQGFTNGSVLFIDEDGRVAEHNTGFYFEINGTGGKLAVGSYDKLRNIIQAVASDSKTDLEDVKGLIGVRNTHQTDGTVSGYTMQTVDSDGDVYSTARIFGMATSHQDDNVSGNFLIETRDEDVRAVKWWFMADGKTGFGTDAAQNMLHLNTTADSGLAKVQFTDETTGATATDGFTFGLGTTQKASFWNYEDTDMNFGTNNLLRMVIDNDGNIGINTTDPQNTLNVVGNGNFTGTIYSNENAVLTSEVDPYWTANQSSYSTTAEIIAFNYWNDSYATFNKTYADALYYGLNNPYGYYNSSDFNISDYATTLYADSLGNFSAWDKDYADLINTPTLLSNFTDDLGDRGYTHLTNFTDDILWTSDFNTTLNNSIEVYGYSTTTGTVTSVSTDDTYLTGGAITSTGTITFNSTLAGTSLAVNSSDYWDNLGSPSDINAGDITDDGTYRLNSWDNFTGIPTATPSDGDTTHLSTAGQIYDWVVGKIAELTHLSNFTDDLGDRGYTSVSNFTNDLGYYNSSDFSISDYFTSAEVLGFNYYNATDFSITDYFTKTDIEGFGYYNSTDFSIGDYSTTTQMNTAIETANTSMLNYVDGTFLTSETDPYWTANQSSYSTTAEADLLYADISVVSNPFDQELNTTSNVEFNNVTVADCILFTNGAELCGV